ALPLTTAALGTAMVTATALAHEHPWPVTVLLAVVAFDFSGGAAATATPSVRAQHHGTGGTRLRRLGFVALHLHPFVLAVCVTGFGWPAATVLYGCALAGAVAVDTAPPPLRRSTALAATVLGTVVTLPLLGAAPELTWVAPVMLVKLLLGHMLPETARPAPAATPHGAGAPTHDEEDGDHGTQARRPGGPA
ncbi:hypothetical protein, partial [Nocardiopsis sp. MG754419]|uniref:hypothetical protein n=1 Tax=Nocardiopsis sp. MG754419 TaxID=2259865 RepID=UPI001BA5841A